MYKRLDWTIDGNFDGLGLVFCLLNLWLCVWNQNGS